jgi:hypothetical protein
MTSGDEDVGGDDDYLGCSFKTVIHRPIPHFYLPTTDNLPQQAPPVPLPPVLPPAPPTIALTPSPLIPAPAIPVLVIPPPPVNLPIHHRAHTDTDLLYYNQQNQPVFYPPNWYPPLPPGYVYGPPPSAFPPPPTLSHQPSIVIQPVPFRRSSADCRRTANNINEPHVIHPERVW